MAELRLVRGDQTRSLLPTILASYKGFGHSLKATPCAPLLVSTIETVDLETSKLTSSATVPSTALCEYCKLILLFNPTLTEYGRQDCYPHFPALAASAAAGCPACDAIRHRIQHEFEQRETPSKPGFSIWDKVVSISHVKVSLENDALNDLVPDPQNGPFRLALRLSAPVLHPTQGVYVAFDVYADEDNVAARQGKIQRRLPSPHPLTAKNVKIVKGLIRECLEHHEVCRLNGPTRLPKRFLDVCTGDDGRIRLVETEQLPPTSPYAALSHTWGQKSFLTTELDTIPDRLRGIPLSAMPQNFQDAVKVARTLDLRYLWIDSLCIIQDSKIDWATESSRMDQVYASAYVTIVATSAASAHDGFLARSPHPYPPVKVPYTSGGNQCSAGFFYLSPRYAHDLSSDHDEHVEGSVWNSRGWTFQERVLSRRSLHFTKHMLYFECRAGDWMEDNRPPASSINRTPWLGSDHVANQRSHPNTRTDKEVIYRSWYDLIVHYSRRNFTKVGDKLPALAGLAHEMAELVHDQYLAGLWKNDLSRGLFWNTADYGDAKKSGVYRAPSWSWAQFDGSISYFPLLSVSQGLPRTCLCCFDVLEAEVEGAYEDPMGRSRSGWLKLKGPLQRISSIRMKDHTYPDDPYSHEIFSDAGRVGKGHLDQPNISVTGPGLFAFLLQLDNANDEDGEDYPLPRCLLLEATGKSPHEYRRIGTMSIYKEFRASGLLESLDFFDTSGRSTIVII